MRVTSKGQITIPQDIRRLAGMPPGSEVEFQIQDGKVVLEKVEVDPARQRQRIQATIQSVAGSATSDPVLRTDEILRMARGEN